MSRPIATVLVLAAGCNAPAVDLEAPEECAAPEVVTIRQSMTLVDEAGFVTAECEDDQHAVRGWCSATQSGRTVSPLGAYGTDAIDLRGRTSTHAAQVDGWTCSGLAAGVVRVTAWVECESGGGMRP